MIYHILPLTYPCSSGEGEERCTMAFGDEKPPFQNSIKPAKAYLAILVTLECKVKMPYHTFFERA